MNNFVRLINDVFRNNLLARTVQTYTHTYISTLKCFFPFLCYFFSARLSPITAFGHYCFAPHSATITQISNASKKSKLQNIEQHTTSHVYAIGHIYLSAMRIYKSDCCVHRCVLFFFFCRCWGHYH